MPIPVEVLMQMMQFEGNPFTHFPHIPVTDQEVKPDYVATESKYSQWHSGFKLLSNEERANLVARAMQALSSFKMQKAGFSFPFQKSKLPDVFTIGEKKYKLGCSFGHGVSTGLGNSEEYAGMVSEIMDGHQVKGSHWQYMLGLLKHVDTAHGVPNPNIQAVAKLMNDHFNEYGENIPYIHVCHSEGANTANESLKLIPKERRKNIHIIAVGPAKYIDPEACGSVLNIVNNNDKIAKKVDKKGFKKALSDRNIRIAEEDPSVGLFEAHAFINPNTQAAFKEELEKLFRILTQDE